MQGLYSGPFINYVTRLTNRVWRGKVWCYAKLRTMRGKECCAMDGVWRVCVWEGVSEMCNFLLT